jgi:oligoribonuclease
MLIWVDLETTGLNPREDQILEIFAIATNDQLEEIGEPFNPPGPTSGPTFHRVLNGARHIPFAELDPAVQTMHLANGMWLDSLQASDDTLTAGAAFRDWIRGLIGVKTDERGAYVKPNLAGSSVHFDAEFLRRWMPEAHALLSHRHLDVSAINETARRFWPKLYEARPRNATKAHRGEADIRESIGMLRHYLQGLRPTESPVITVNTPSAPPPDMDWAARRAAESVGEPVVAPIVSVPPCCPRMCNKRQTDPSECLPHRVCGWRADSGTCDCKEQG